MNEDDEAAISRFLDTRDIFITGRLISSIDLQLLIEIDRHVLNDLLLAGIRIKLIVIHQNLFY